ncbi:MAG: 4Fe-4S binding protein [Kiritimatiellae bacterium]|nr:4Fe-4S binding protein [Kiritimatiellia bacterium]
MKWLRRNALRLLIAAGAALLALGYVPEACTCASSLLPRLSPILSILGALAARAWLGWLMLLAVPLLVLAFFKGRFFCWHLCPMGFLSETAGRLNPRGKGLVRRVPPFNKAIALVVAVSAACGYPLFIWLDPLCMFNGFFAAWREPFTWAAATTGIGFVAVITLSVLVPDIWCHRLCPLGGLQESVSLLARRFRAPTDAPPVQSSLTAASATRRTVLAAIPAAAASIAIRRALGANGRNAIRPPGADLERINALCARCGNCMKACPYGLIQPDLGETGIDGLFTPVLRLRSRNLEQEQYCFQDCVACTEVCPTGALRPITVDEKHSTPIGLAVIDRRKCIAWEKKEYCAVCDEYCPYKAIKLTEHGGVNCPTVDADKCRGCGACESNCPADPIAIVVKPC